MGALDDRIAEVVVDAATSDRYHLLAGIGAHDYHLAFSIMGDVKRINVCEQDDGTVPDTEETRYVIDQLWAGLNPTEDTHG